MRHHSPACAGLVRRRLQAIRPRRVLIEGPAEFNDRMAELALDHEPPVALLTTAFLDGLRFASWAPFCAHSPEWIALRDGLRDGADVRFIDLPAWASGRSENRYADLKPIVVDPMASVGAAMGEQGFDATWDACFELPDPVDLPQRLTATFHAMRDADEPSAADIAREAFMADWVRWAAGQPDDTVVICGGYHAPVLEQAAAASPLPAPPSPPPPPPNSRAATWLVPYDERRLDAFTGYAAGMPSPAWCRWVWESGTDAAARQAIEATAGRLRRQGRLISVADVTVAWTLAQGLARLRGHSTVARVDLLDAIVSAWVKEGLDDRLPWISRRPIGPHTHPVIVELLAALTGEGRGRLDPLTPAPPLLAAVHAELHALGLSLDVAAPLTVATAGRDDQQVALSRLQLLRVPGLRALAPRRWEIHPHPDTRTHLIEVASYGPTLFLAASALLDERAVQAQGVDELVALLHDALRCELPALSAPTIARLGDAVAREHDLGPMGAGLHAMVGLIHHGELDAAMGASVRDLSSTLVDRILWTVEGLTGSGPCDPPRVDAVLAVTTASAVPGVAVPGRVQAVFERVARAEAAPADLRGAALGALVRLEAIAPDALQRLTLSTILHVDATRLGDALYGLLRLAREALDDPLLQAVDQVLAQMNPDDFLTSLPALRQAFHGLPSRERGDVGVRVGRLHGHGPGVLLTQRLTVDPQVIARAHRLEAEADRLWSLGGLEDT